METKTDKSLPTALVGQLHNDIDSVATAKAIIHQSNGDVMLDILYNDEKLNGSSNFGSNGAAVTPVQEEPNSIFGNQGLESISSNFGQNQYIAENPATCSTSTYSPPPEIITSMKKEKNYLLAASYIEDARFGRTLEYNIDEESLWNYRKYSNVFFHWGTIGILWLLLFLALFEKPAVEGIAMPFWGTMIIEVCCLAVISFRLYQMFKFVPRRTFLTDPKNIVVAATILITIVDMIIYIGMKSSPSTTTLAVRVSRAFRPLFLINMNESRQVRRAFRNIRNTVPEIINVLILFIFSIALFTLLAFKLFEKRGLHYRSNKPYFTDYGDAFFDLYVLVTTANSPDVMMPAYDNSPWFALFFIVYIITNTYIFINLFLAVIYNSYRAHLKTEIRASVMWKRKKLEQAFELLKESDDNPVITSETWVQVMRKISRPQSFAKINLYWEVLHHGKDENLEIGSTSTITKDDFLQVSNLLNVFIVQDTTSVNIFVRLAPQVYLSRPSTFIRFCVNHRFFVYLFDILIIANAVCIGLDQEDAEWFFLSIFMLEIILRIYTLGPTEYFSLDRLWNWFDFLIITAALIATVIEASLDELTEFPREALDFLLVLRCLRLLKIVGTIERFRVLVMTILNIAPSLAIYGAVLLMIYYVFAIIGMEVFGDLIHFYGNSSHEENMCGDSKLEGSEFVRVGYCGNNFNDILRSMVTLIELTVVNQWHVFTTRLRFNSHLRKTVLFLQFIIMLALLHFLLVIFSYVGALIASGFEIVTSKAARVYFVCFHLIVVILIMNIIVAFVLEAFILEYSLSKTNIESKVEKTIESLGLMADVNVIEEYTDKTNLVNENDGEETEIKQYGGKPDSHHHGPRHRFRINKGHKNVEVLLHRMFEGELEDEHTRAQSSEPTITLDGVVGTSVTI